VSKTFLILRRNGRDTIKNVFWSSCTVQLSLLNFNETSSFSKKITNNSQIPIFMKIPPVGAESLHADRQTGVQTERDRQTVPT
jgi:hypothetical protein